MTVNLVVYANILRSERVLLPRWNKFLLQILCASFQSNLTCYLYFILNNGFTLIQGWISDLFWKSCVVLFNYWCLYLYTKNLRVAWLRKSETFSRFVLSTNFQCKYAHFMFIFARQGNRKNHAEQFWAISVSKLQPRFRTSYWHDVKVKLQYHIIPYMKLDYNFTEHVTVDFRNNNAWIPTIYLKLIW